MLKKRMQSNLFSNKHYIWGWGDGYDGTSVRVLGDGALFRDGSENATALWNLLGDDSDAEGSDDSAYDEKDGELDGREGNTGVDGVSGMKNEQERSGLNDEWVHFKLFDCLECTELLEFLLEFIQFSLGEHITLGLLPYCTHGQRSTEDGIEGSDYESSNVVACNDYHKNDERTPEGSSVREHTSATVNEMQNDASRDMEIGQPQSEL